jgi:hypothetical protein
MKNLCCLLMPTASMLLLEQLKPLPILVILLIFSNQTSPLRTNEETNTSHSLHPYWKPQPPRSRQSCYRRPYRARTHPLIPHLNQATNTYLTQPPQQRSI